MTRRALPWVVTLVVGWTAAAGAPPPVETPARIDAWFDDLARGAGSVDGWIALDHLQSHQEYLDVAPRLDGAAERLLTRRGTDPLLAARLHEWQGTRADRRGDGDAARAHFASAGYPADWATLGPFLDYGGADVEEPIGPELEGCADGCGDNRATAAWVERPGLGAHGYADLAGCFEGRRDSVAFLRAYLHVARDTEVAFHLGGGDGVALDVGGRRLIEDPARRRPRADQRVAGVELRAGWTEVRVKAGQQSGSWGVYLRVTAPDGRPADGLAWSIGLPEGEGTVAAGDGEVPVHDPLGDALAAAAEDGASGAILARAAWLATATDRFDERGGEPLRLARGALDAGVDDPALRLLVAEHTDEPEERLVSIEAALARAPGLAPAQLALRQYRLDQSNPRDDLPPLRAALADPDALRAGRAWAEELWDMGADEAALDRIDELLVRHPGASTLHVLRGQIWLDLGNEARALEAYTQGLAIADLSSTRSRRLGLRRQGGDMEGALADARVLAERFPHGLRIQRNLARELERSGRPEEAAEHLRQVAPRFPDAAGLRQQLGDLCHRLGDDEAAFAAWEASLQIQPRNPRLEQYLGFLAGEEDPLRERWRRDPAQVLARAPGAPADSHARVLLHNQAIQVFDSGSEQEYTQRLVRIDTEVGARAFGQVDLRYDRDRERLRVLTAELLHPDGSRSPARQIHEESGVSRAAGAYYAVYSKRVTFDEPRPGDVLHLEFKRESREKRNRFGDFFGAIVPLQDAVPTDEIAVRIAVPDGMELHAGGKGIPALTVTDEGGARIHELVATDLPALPSESNSPGYYEVGAYLSVSNFATWDQVASWWLELSRDQFLLGDEGERLARELAEGAADEREVVRRIYAHVVRDTHYVGLEFGIHGWKPYEAREVLERGYGDCKDKATLLVSMLAAVGVPAEVVILQTVANGRTVDHPPSLRLFDHAIAYVPSLDLYLDGTTEFSPVEALRWDDQGALALRIPLEGPATLVTIPVSTPEQNVTRSDTRVELGRSGDARFAEYWTEQGNGVAEIRGFVPDESTRLQDLEDNYQARLTGVRLTDVRVSGFGDLGNELVLEVDGEVPALARVEGERLRVPVTLFPEGLGQLMAPEGSRRTDLFVRLPRTVRQSTTIVPPPGMVAVELPDPVELETPHVRYSQVVTREAGAAVVRTELIYRSRRVPVDDYPAFREFCLAVDHAQSLSVVLAPEGGP